MSVPAELHGGEAARGDGLSAPPRLVDCDVHNEGTPATFAPYLPQRWRSHVEAYGLRSREELDSYPALRTPSRRADAHPPGGGPPGSDPEFSRRQLLDEFGIDIGVLTCLQGQAVHVGYNQPAELSAALARATNDWVLDAWFGSDPRWRSAIHARVEEPRAAVAEIERCAAASDRFVQIAVAPRTERPLGHPKYWDLFEAAAELDLPISLHPAGMGGHSGHATGVPSSFFELHAGLHFSIFSAISSLIFEGVFDRWPTLRIVVIELGWAWVAPWAWRLDACQRVLGSEVSLQRKPSEYIADHFWFTTQPMEAPEDPRWFNAVYEQFESVGLAGHLMFSTDYPHWDFDSPLSAVPKSLPEETRSAIFGGNAAALYGLGAP